MNVTDVGPEYDKIAALVVNNAGGETDGVYLFVEAESAYVGAGIYRDAGDKVHYVGCSTELFVAISNLWEALPPEQQWTVMQMDIEGGKFDARFEFTEDEPDGDGDDLDDREDKAIAARFGNKEIVYPDD